MAREHTPLPRPRVQLPGRRTAATFRSPLHQRVRKLRIVVENIPDDGLDVRIHADAAWASEAARIALEGPVRALTGDVRVGKKGARVRVDGHVDVSTVRACERCGEDVELALAVDPELEYVPAQKGDEEELELESEDLDVGWYENGGLEMADVLCEALSLALPPRVVCEDAAACDARTAALLSTEGKSGNPGHPGFAALKNFGR